MTTTVLTVKGQVVIPAKIRRHLNLKKGTRLYVEENGSELILRPVTRNYFNKLAGVLRTKGKLSSALLDERARDKAKEAKV